MRALYFHAAAGHPAVSAALMRQAENTLRPFDRFLNQAIRTTKERQTRYQLPWEKVADPQEIHLTPVDRLVVVPRRRPGWWIVDWPPGEEPDNTQKLVAANRGLMFDVVEWSRNPAGGLHIRTDGELREDDQVWWCGRPRTLAREPVPAPPSTVENTTEEHLQILRAPQPREDGWVLVLAGEKGEDELVVDGVLVKAHERSATEGLRQVSDGAGHTFDVVGGLLKVDELPTEGLLAGDNGVRFRWRAKSRKGGRRSDGEWVQLLAPENVDSEDFLDPRAAFCEGEIDEVWTQERRGNDTAIRVRKVDADRYRLLLDRLPPAGTPLLLPVNTHNLALQRRALRQLSMAPLPHHHGLLRLCERPDRVRWPPVREVLPDRWHILTDKTRDGTDEQRTFVAKALGTRDIALLEGPPGSGKTTAICELIWQAVARGDRVLLCASTHVAIDNVLERLIKAGAPIDAVRIGKSDRVDENVRAAQLDHKVDQLVDAWKTAPHLSALAGDELRDMAERTVIDAANLTCGTTMGIVHHPLFRDRDQSRRPWDQPITTMPHWDLLIVDEASKTLTQEFLVPALAAKHWVVVGDVRQLAPFVDRADLVANLRSLLDDNNRAVFPDDHQRARLLLVRLAGPELRRTNARWLVAETPSVLDRLGEELLREQDAPPAVRVVSRTGVRPGPFHEVSVEQVCAGDTAALALLACPLVLVANDLLPEVADHLPGDLMHHRDLTGGEPPLPKSHPLRYRHAWWLDRSPVLSRRVRGKDTTTTLTQVEADEQRWLTEHDLAAEITWRLTRIHELRRSGATTYRERLSQQLHGLLPVAVDISERIAEIQHIGLPSIIEVLQDGISDGDAGRPSALTRGMRYRHEEVFGARFTSLSYQHRMHPEISDFPRDEVYGGRSLKDANTIDARDREVGWTFVPFARRRAWVDVPGAREYDGANEGEIGVMESILRAFLAWAAEAGPPRSDQPRPWEVACLSFYLKQEQAISRMLQRVTGNDKRRTRFTAGNAELVCAAVDRFQGREADLVLLSMRNTGRVGFLDSPNRLNVAVTRARQQLVVIGKADYFARCGRPELEALVASSHREDARRWLRRRS